MKKSTLLARILFILISLSVIVPALMGQKKPSFPEDGLRQEEYNAHLRFLASDELMGRMTGSPWNDVAARYIAEQYRASHLQTFPSAPGYFQPVDLRRRIPPASGWILFAGDTLRQGKTMVMRNGGETDLTGPMVYAGYGLVDSSKGIDDYRGIDAKGKVVVVRFGMADMTSWFAGFSSFAETKRRLAAEHGAVALIEMYGGVTRGAPPWRSIAAFASRPGFELSTAGPALPHFLVEDSSLARIAAAEVKTGERCVIHTEGIRSAPVNARNVIGWVKGSDPKLSKEYVLLTAHYDHIGTGRGRGPASADTIFNGARDNAMGVVALIAAARSFSEHPPKRSVIIAAVTGEEIGEFGSRWLADHPPVPMNQIVFDMNSDGAGFDDTTAVTVVGLERTTAENAIKEGAKRYGLKAIPDPVPEQDLFNRSDNVNFARKGVPAPTFSAGFHSFGEEINKYYHQADDEAGDDFNFSYALKFYKAFVHASRLVADMSESPFWRPGDQYEKAGKRNYVK